MTDNTLTAGVIGVGSMGSHHARVYDELAGVELCGVSDADESRAERIAAEYGAEAMTQSEVIEHADALSIAVPTRYHYQVAQEALERGVHVIVEKPFVADPTQGRELVSLARANDCRLQVGHVERFNPAVRALDDITPDLDIIAIDARRLGPPVDRDTRDGVVLDLMIHDIDIICAIVGSDIADVGAMRAGADSHVTAQLEFENGVIATLTASRVTQDRVRELAITAEDCRVDVDYKNQNVRIHRHSLPEYYEADGNLRYRHESITERPTVENGEPLKAELRAFVDAVQTDSVPPITGADALDVLDVARRIDDQATARSPER